MLQPRGRRRGRQPVRVRLQGIEEPVDPAVVAPAVVPGRGPRAELLAVVTHHADALAVLGGVGAQVVDDVLDGAERDPVSEALLGAEDGDPPALVLGGVGAPHRVVRDRGSPEMSVVDDGPGVAGIVQRRGHVGLPDTFREPCAAWPLAEDGVQLGGHAPQLADPVTFRQRREDRLAPAATHDLHLPPGVQRDQPLHGLRSLGSQPVQQGTGVVEPEPDARVSLQGLDHGQVGRIVVGRDDVSEVAHRLVVVQHERQGDASVHRRRILSGRPVSAGPTAAGRAPQADRPQLVISYDDKLRHDGQSRTRSGPRSARAARAGVLRRLQRRRRRRHRGVLHAGRPALLPAGRATGDVRWRRWPSDRVGRMPSAGSTRGGPSTISSSMWRHARWPSNGPTGSPAQGGHLRGIEICVFDADGLMTEIRAAYAAPASAVVHEYGDFPYAGTRLRDGAPGRESSASTPGGGWTDGSGPGRPRRRRQRGTRRPPAGTRRDARGHPRGCRGRASPPRRSRSPAVGASSAPIRTRTR